jgi:hypothetical protein
MVGLPKCQLKGCKAIGALAQKAASPPVQIQKQVPLLSPTLEVGNFKEITHACHWLRKKTVRFFPFIPVHAFSPHASRSLTRQTRMVHR